MKDLNASLETGFAQLNALRAIFSQPCFDAWYAYNLTGSLALVQLWPEESKIRSSSTECEVAALKLARAIGGKWSKRGDGSWEARVPAPEGGFPWQVILHRVEAARYVEAFDVDPEQLAAGIEDPAAAK